MEETEGLDFLIQQRNNRRRLMRMISWGRPVDGTAKRSDIVDERPCLDDEVSTGDEEFFSAEEGSDISEEGVEEIESDSEEEPINLSERKKPSKRKRKRLKQLLKSLEDPPETEEFSFVHFFAPDYKSKQLERNDFEVGAGSCVKRHVPSLVELCLESCRSLEHWQKLPPGIRRLMSVFRYEESLRLLQIEWCHRILSRLEKKLTLPPAKSDEKDGICSQVCFVRDLKRAGTIGSWQFNYYSENIPSKTNVFPVVWPLRVADRSTHCRQQGVGPYNSSFFASTGLEVMASIIDLMLPVTVGKKQRKWKKYKHDQSDEEERSLASALSKIRHTLEKRHPKYTNYMYRLAEGYALWVRGDVENAEKSFNRHLSRKGVDNFHKALIRNEIGRMFMMFGDLVKASQYFLEAAVDEEDDEEKNATMQALALIATQTDTGLLTATKAQESAAAWLALIRRKESYIPNLGCSAVESAMRVYAGHVIDQKLTSKWHVDVLERLTQMTHMADNARLAKVFVYAMLGEERASKETFTNYLSCLGPSFYEPEKSQYLSSFPFDIILDQMKDRARPIQPIKLLWRTQMRYPSFSNDEWECDYHSKPTDDCSLPLNLHLSDEGYLTGDMSMQTPPIRGIYLDPYTGGLCLPHVPLRATPWKDLSVHQPAHVELACHRETFRLPRILRVMDNDKCVVDFCIVSDAVGCNQSTTLTWIGSDGMRMTLDLKKMIREAARKDVEATLNALREKNGDDWVNERMELLDLFMKRGWIVNLLSISAYAEYLEKKKEWEKEPQKEKKRQIKEKKKPWKYRTTKPTVNKIDHFKLVLDAFYTFSDTVLFQFKPDLDACNHKRSPYLVVVNCNSIHTFKAPKIYSNVHHLAAKTDWSHQLAVTTTSLQSCQGHTQKRHFPHAEIFIVKGRSREETMSIFDVDGNVTDGNVTDQVMPKEQDRPQYYVVGKHFYYIKQQDEITGLQKRSVDVEENEDDYRPLADLHPPHQVEDIFIIKMALGICVMNPLSMELFTLNKLTESLTYSLESNSTIIMGEFYCITTFSSRRKKSGKRHQGEVVQVAVGVGGCVFILEVPFDGKSCQYGSVVDVVLQVSVPGIPREICLISYEAGFIVAASLSEDHKEDGFRNHVYQFSFDGKLLGILPFLGQGPHRFTPIYLEQSKEHEDLGEDVGKPGWHVFFVDGHGALACFNASATED